jgi:hypothetical protein
MNKKIKNYLVISRKERWGLTVWGWLVLIILILFFSSLFLRNLYSILSPVHREKTGILVLEGFISDYVLEDAIREFKTGHYSLLVTTGTPIEQGALLVQYRNTARLAAESLKKLGFDSSRLVVVEASEIMYDRTYNSGIAFRCWLETHRPDVKAVNLMTMSVHGARSKFLFQSALGNSIKVGIISLPNMFYGPYNWWHSSKGFRETLNEAIGYYYVKFFFRPYEKELKKPGQQRNQ